MSQIVLQGFMVALSIVLYLGAMVINDVVFIQFQEIPGVNWVFLPAGVRLLCTLLFGIWGVSGIALASLFVATQYMFPDQGLYAFGLSFISAFAPYMVYLAARHYFGLAASLINLSPGRLILCCVAFGIVSSSMHHFWFWLHDANQVSLKSLLAMITGDIIGAVIVLYIMKIVLALLPRPSFPNPE